MRKPLSVAVLASVAFVVSAGLHPRFDTGFDYPTPAYAAGTCSLSALVCANDSSPGCEIICAGEQRPVCVEGLCSPAGNIVTPNNCSCK